MLKLSIASPEDDYNPDTLIDSDIATEMIYINVFDEQVVDILKDERQKGVFFHERRDRVWLGSLAIPFSTVWERTRIDGAFPLSIPQALHQYDKPAAGSGKSSTSSQLNLFITLDPPLLQPQNLNVKFQSQEDPKLLKYADQWVASFPPESNVKAVVQDMSGQTNLICRFIRPQNPPANLKTVKEIVRFVSVIPYLANRIAFGANCSLWSTTEQILEVGSADSIEHAILLCNFLTFKQLDAWIALGYDLLDGSCAYVLVRRQKATEPAAPPPIVRKSSWLESVPFFSSSQSSMVVSEYQLYNAVTGTLFDQNDTHCTLENIGCIFNGDNVTNSKCRFGATFSQVYR